MKFYKKLILVSAIFTILISVLYIKNTTLYASTNNYNILDIQTGEIGAQESKQFSMQVPIESEIIIKFIGWYDSEDLEKEEATYGDAKIQIINSNNEIVYENFQSIRYDDVNISTNLSKGNYILKFIESDNYHFEYDFYVIGRPTVDVKAESIKLNKTKLDMKKGQRQYLVETVSPYYATSSVTWNSSNKKIATVNNEGQVVAKNLGSAKIKAEIDGKTVNCQITVNKTDRQKLICKKSKSFSKLVKYIPGYKNAKWSSSKKSIATVSKTGKVSAKKNGKCNIICKIGKKKYTIPIKVVTLVTAKPDGVEEKAIYNDAWVKVTNNSNKDITYMTLQIYQYNNKGSKLKSPYSYYYINDTTKANNYDSYSFWVNDDTKKIKVKILKVWFSDGSTWKP